MSDDTQDKPKHNPKGGRPKNNPEEVVRGTQPAGKQKRGRGRPPKREMFQKDPRDHRAYAPKLPDIAYQVDQDLEDLDQAPTRKYSDWAKIKWKLFADAYYQTGSAVESYKLAGYEVTTEGSAYTGGSRLLQHPWVQAYLRRRELAEVPEIDLTTQDLPDEEKDLLIAKDDEIIMFLTKIMRDHSLPANRRVEAAKELAKLKGMYTEKIEITSPADTEQAVKDALGLSDDE